MRKCTLKRGTAVLMQLCWWLVGGNDGAEVVGDTNVSEHAGRRFHALVSYAGDVFRERGKAVSLLNEIEVPRVDECLMDIIVIGLRHLNKRVS